MIRNSKITQRFLAASTGFFIFLSLPAQAVEIRVITSGAFTEAYKQLIPEFEKQTGHKVISSFGASIGNAPDAIPTRLARGEKFDLVILSDGGLEALVKSGYVVKGSRVDLVRSQIGAAVRKGTPKPDISTVEALKKTLLDAKSIAYSASASGVYLSTELFPKLGVAEQLKDKAKKNMGGRAVAMVWRGDAELGFQQVSELIYFKELDFIGTLPESVQQTIFFSAGLIDGSNEQATAKELVRFFQSPGVAEVIRKTGLDPVTVR